MTAPPPPRVIALDGDGTLHNEGRPNLALIEWCKKQKAAGFTLMPWSSRGEAYARQWSEALSIAGLFDLVCAKPGYVVDDQGWGWTRYTKVITNIRP